MGRQENWEKSKIVVVAGAAQYENSKFDSEIIKVVAFNSPSNVLHAKMKGEKPSVLEFKDLTSVDLSRT